MCIFEKIDEIKAICETFGIHIFRYHCTGCNFNYWLGKLQNCFFMISTLIEICYWISQNNLNTNTPWIEFSYVRLLVRERNMFNQYFVLIIILTLFCSIQVKVLTSTCSLWGSLAQNPTAFCLYRLETFCCY